jgi:hypothetical protein
MRTRAVADPGEIPSDRLLTPYPEGWRCLLLLDDRVRIRSRSGIDLAPWVPEIASAAARLGPARTKVPSVVDAILCWPPRPDDEWPALGRVGDLVLLDLLVHEGRDVTGRVLQDRLAFLKTLARDAAPPITVAPAWRGSAVDAWAQLRSADRSARSGLLARRARGPYRPGLVADDWLLFDERPPREVLLCGIASSGALVLGAPAPRGVGFAGVAFPTRRWTELAARCEPGPPPFPDPGIWPSLGDVAWAEPSLWLSVVREERPPPGRGGPAWRLLHVQEDLSPPLARSAATDRIEEGAS